MTQLETAHAAVGLSWKIKKILRDALGDDFAESNSGITARPVNSAWFRAHAGPELLIDVRVTPADARPATAEEEVLVEVAVEAEAYFRSRESCVACGNAHTNDVCGSEGCTCEALNLP